MRGVYGTHVMLLTNYAGPRFVWLESSFLVFDRHPSISYLHVRVCVWVRNNNACIATYVATCYYRTRKIARQMGKCKLKTPFTYLVPKLFTVCTFTFTEFVYHKVYEFTNKEIRKYIHMFFFYYKKFLKYVCTRW